MAHKITIQSEFEVYDSADELNVLDKDLILKAKEAMHKAYAIYSGFYVGAAVLLENGVIITGNNQENAAYPSGLCAERVAIFHAASQFPGVKIKTIAICAKSSRQKLNHPVTPCGACRQSISEYEIKLENNIRIIMTAEEGPVYISKSIADLLPLTFTHKSL